VHELKFKYTTSEGSIFDLELTSGESAIGEKEVELMSRYIHFLFVTMSDLGEKGKDSDFNQLLRDLMNREEG